MHLKLDKFVQVYNRVISSEVQSVETLDVLEELHGDLYAIANYTSMDFATLVVDDTTSKACDDLRKACRVLEPVVLRICSEYDVISKSDIKILASELCNVATTVAILYYSSYGVSELIAWYQNQVDPNFEVAPMTPELLHLKEDDDLPLDQCMYLVLSVFKEFKPNLIEYTLDDAALGEIQAYIDTHDLPSDYVASMSQEFVDNILMGEI